MRNGHRAFTLIELLVVIAITATVTTLALAAVGRVRGQTQSVQCLSNLRQWGVALNLYANDNDGSLPWRGQGVQPLTKMEPDDWFNCLPPYVGQTGLQEAEANGRRPKQGEHSIFVCPAAKETGGPHFLPYAMNMYLSPNVRRPEPHRRQELGDLSRIAFLADGPGSYSSTVPSNQPYSVKARHVGKRANICFVDGHVATFDGSYLGCGVGQPNPEHDDVHWQTGSSGINQSTVP